MGASRISAAASDASRSAASFPVQSTWLGIQSMCVGWGSCASVCCAARSMPRPFRSAVIADWQSHRIVHVCVLGAGVCAVVSAASRSPADSPMKLCACFPTWILRERVVLSGIIMDVPAPVGPWSRVPSVDPSTNNVGPRAFAARETACANARASCLFCLDTFFLDVLCAPNTSLADGGDGLCVLCGARIFVSVGVLSCVSACRIMPNQWGCAGACALCASEIKGVCVAVWALLQHGCDGGHACAVGFDREFSCVFCATEVQWFQHGCHGAGRCACVVLEPACQGGCVALSFFQLLKQRLVRVMMQEIAPVEHGQDH